MNKHHSITLTRPDDWHCHLRDHQALARTVPDVARQFARAIVMPNTLPPITSLEAARAYQARIQAHIPADCDFTPLMTLYLTESLTPDDIRQAGQSGLITACKLYPAGATTHSSAGIQDLSTIDPLFEAMQQVDLPLLIHGEVTDPNVDIFDREAVFIDTVLAPLAKRFTALRMVLEHVSTQIGVDFVKQAPAHIAATITPHHLWLNRNQLLSGGLRPHHYCLPVIKSAQDQAALITAATSGHAKFFLGTDSAPHSKSAKEHCCAAAGIYNMPVAMAVTATVFEQQQALAQLENFCSRFGAEFYRLPINREKVTLVAENWTVPKTLAFEDETVIPLCAGDTLSWRLTT